MDRDRKPERRSIVDRPADPESTTPTSATNRSDEPGRAREIIGRQIRVWRLHRHISQSGLARAAGIAQASISNYEAGKRDLRVATLIRIANALNVRVEDLLSPETQRAVLDCRD